ncbi:MAG TPA: RNB domain-containing ribonuclease, partial [Thermoleophilia bacterium]|nr:RNB domain-containing ribonuclease [Thermoleophilia bacterium]
FEGEDLLALRRRDRARRDLTELPTFTIDPDTARDFDDAISVAREGDGYRAHVHIADVSYFVDRDGAIDREARQRTSSLYLPLWAEPMLPPALSADLCSLRPRIPRKCLTVEFAFDAAGRRTGVRFYRSLVSSDHRLTYGFVDTILEAQGVSAGLEVGGGSVATGGTAAAVAVGGAAGGARPAGAAAGGATPAGAAALAHPPVAAPLRPAAASPAEAGRPPAAVPDTSPGPRRPPAAVPDATTEADVALLEQLRLAAELAGTLRRRRFARGALRLGSFEPEYEFDEAGRLTGAVTRPETAAHAVVEEFMLAANEAVAEFLLKRRAPAVYRVHEPPDVQSASEFLAQLEELGVPAPALPEGALDGGQLSRVYARAAAAIVATSAREGRGRLAWPTLLLRSLKQAVYAPQNRGHFGLASPGYLHFTSPIRRYPDLVVHRALLKELGEGPGTPGDEELAAIAEDCSVAERAFARLETDGDDIALTFLLDRRLRELGWQTAFPGEITGLVPGGLFVRFAEVHEGYLPMRSLGGERFSLSEHETAAVGDASGRRFRLGDGIAVRVERLDRVRGRVDLVPVLEEAQRPVRAPGRAAKRRRGGARTPRRPAPDRRHHHRRP